MPRSQIKIFPYFIISHQSHNEKLPNVKIELSNETPNGIEIDIAINLREHNGKCPEDSSVYLQAFSNSGKGLPNFELGTFKELCEPEIGEYIEWKHRLCEDLNKEDARFRVIVCEWGSFKDVKVPRIVGQANIDNFYQVPQSGEKRKVSWIKTIEKDIPQAFKVQMEPGEKPILILKKGSNIKQKLDDKSEVIQRTLIYTSIVREILTTYLIDTSYEACEIKEVWLNKISEKIEKPVTEFDESLVWHEHERNYTIVDDVKNLIEESVAAMVSELKTSTNERLIDAFIKENDSTNLNIDEIEDLN